ncbi:MAG: hypothetical protein E7206_17680 [Clostridium beijerinckii]|nr:hypothetical protein [Clostridium beijerinckii]
MVLSKSQQKMIQETEEIMKKYDLEEDEGYKIFTLEVGDFRKGIKEINIAIQFRYVEKIVARLRKIGWNTGHRYYTNGQVRWYSDGDSKDNYGDVEMIQMIPRD